MNEYRVLFSVGSVAATECVHARSRMAAWNKVESVHPNATILLVTLVAQHCALSED